MEDVDAAIGQLAFMKRRKMLSPDDYKESKAFLEALQDDKFDEEKETKVEKARKLKKAQEANAREQMKAIKEMNKIVLEKTVTNSKHKKGNTYLVVYTCKGLYPSGNHTTISVSQTVKAQGNENDNNMIRKAFELWILLHYKADSPPNLIWNSVKGLRILENGVGTDLTHIQMGSLWMMYKSFQDLPEDFRLEKNMCVAEYLMYESARAGRKSWHKDLLVKKLGHKPSVEKIIEFAKEEEDVSVYALDLFYNVFRHHVAHKSKIVLYFMCNNGHLYPILDDTHRKKITAKHELVLDDLRLRYSDFEEENVMALPSRNRNDFDDNLIETILSCDAPHVIVTDISDLLYIANAVMRRTNHNIEKWSFHEKELKGFRHPVKEQVISAGQNYYERKNVCEHEYKKNEAADFKFLNQGWGTIARSIFVTEYGMLPVSHYSPDVKVALANNVVPYRMCVDKSTSGCKSIDITKCYASILENNKYDFPIHGAFDCAEPITLTGLEDVLPGQYYVNKTFYMGYGTIKKSRGWQQYEVIDYALRQGYITLSNVTHAIKARSKLSASTFRSFVDYCFRTHPNDAKMLVNCLIGCFGALYVRKEKAGVTSDLDTMIATLKQYHDKGMDAKMYEFESIYILRLLEEQMKSQGDITIYRSVLNQSHIALDKLCRAVVIPGVTKIIGYNTDSIKIKGRFNSSMLSHGGPRGSFHLEKVKPLSGLILADIPEYPEWHFKPLQVQNVVDAPVTEASELRLGMAGCGKSWLLSQNYVASDVVLCYTNACCEQLKRYGVEAQTFESFVPKESGASIASFKDAKRVWLDEYKTLPPNLMDLLLRAKEAYKFQLICLGDWRQTCAPCDDWVEYHTNRRFLEALGGRIVHMSYKPETGRYDKDMYEKLNAFCLTGRVDFENTNLVVSDHNVCLHNATRHSINKERLEAWIVKTGAALHNVVGKQDGKERTMPIAVGLEMMVYYNNDLERKLFKTHRYVIEDIQGDVIRVKNDVNSALLSSSEFVALFDYAFAYTMYKIQGITIPVQYNIHQSAAMSRNELYTSLSRGKRLADIHLDAVKMVYFWDKEEQHSYVMKKAEYKIGRIYMIEFSDGSAYIGQTEQDIQLRFYEHLMNPTNDAMRHALQTLNPQIKMIEQVRFHKKEVLNEIEENHIYHEKSQRVLLNKQHNHASVQMSHRHVVPKKMKLAITEQNDKKRFVFSFTKDGVRSKVYEPFGNDKLTAYDSICLKREEILHKLVDGCE